MVSTRTPTLAPYDAQLFAAARLRAARLQPYLASAVFSLVPVPQPGLGTFAVDRWWRVYVDMETARGWGVEATAAVLLHETHHVVRDHHARADRLEVTEAQAHRWNLAADAAINDDLQTDGLELPSPVLPEHLGLDEGLIEETYYRALTETAVTRDRDSCGSGAGGEPLPVEIADAPDESGADGLDPVDQEAVRRAVAHEVVRACDRDESVSPGLTRWARDTLQPEVPWQSLLRSTLGRTIRAATRCPHPDWTRPDRRSDSRPDFPRPGQRGHRPEVAVVIDTSASMSSRLLDAAVSEINSLLHRVGVAGITVVVCDSDAVRPQRVRRLGQLVLQGGGGTDLRPGIAAAAATRPTPAAIAVLTDGYTPWPSEAPPRSQLIAVVIGSDAPLPSGPGIQSLRIHESW